MKKFNFTLTHFFWGVFLISQLSYCQVVEQWAKTYNGTGNSVDESFAMAVDGSGNVIVTGASYNGSEYDYLTIKYTSLGDTAWVRRYHTTGSGYATCIAADASGNIYVSGHGFIYNGLSNFSCFTTLKYSPSGDLLWTSAYPPNGDGSDSKGNSIAVDGNGNVYVTGEVGNATSQHFGTVKFNSNGVQQWAQTYSGRGPHGDGANAIALDQSGNVYITGDTRDSLNTYSWYTTIKYNNNGDSLWVRNYYHGTNLFLKPYFLILDVSGNVYINGYSATVKYNSSGVQQWDKIYLPLSTSNYFTGPRIAVDASGNLFTILAVNDNTNTTDFMTVKYGPNGDSLWAKRFSAPDTSYDAPSSMTTDNSGNVYVTGYQFFHIQTSYWTTIKYNTNGDSIWVKRHSGGVFYNYYTMPYAIKVDNSNNVYLTGLTYNSASNLDYHTVKYASCNLTVNAGNDTTIWNLSTSHANLTAGVTGGSSPYHYQWSTGDTTQSITASPADTTAYFVNVTDGSGCSASDTVVVKVFHIACGSNNVYVCLNGQTRCIKINQLQRYINRGATLGQCVIASPKQFALNTNYPNPFNPVTSISFSIPKPTQVKLIIYDILGREVSKLVDQKMEAGTYRFNWNGDNYASGIYFYTLRAGDFYQTKKMILIK